MTATENLRGDRVLVVGATGGVGQLTVAKLLEKDYQVRVLVRNAEKAQKMFDDQVEIVVGDIRDPTTLPAAVEKITHIICCAGTTAFPSSMWEFDTIEKGQENPIEWLKIYLNPESTRARASNSPDKVDAEGVSNLLAAAPKALKRFIFVSSIGIRRKDKPPFNILNAFGVLDAKQKGEEAIARSGLPYTIIRPGRLIDGPYTSYDLNRLLKATTGGKLGVVVLTGDTLLGEASRIDVASDCVESIGNSVTEGKVFEIINKGPRPEAIDWTALFSIL